MVKITLSKRSGFTLEMEPLCFGESIQRNGQESWLWHVGAMQCLSNPRASMKVTCQIAKPPHYKTVVRINKTITLKHYLKCEINI